MLIKVGLSFWLILTSFSLDALNLDSDPVNTNSLGAVIKHTKKMYESGVDKKEIAEWLAKVIDKRLISSNNGEWFRRPVYAWRGVLRVRMNPSTENQEYNEIANAAWTFGYGNCGENAMVTYYILKKAGVKEHLRVLQAGKNRSHSFAVWDMPPDANPANPLTWGDALIVDSWLGQVLNGKEAREHKWYQNGDPNEIMRDGTTLFDKDAISWQTIVRDERRRTGKSNPNEMDPLLEEDCFIASAVYGTPLNNEIHILRTFRDQKLRKNIFGRLFISIYERFGPIAAYYIKQNENRKLWARQNLVEPALELAK